MIRARASVQRHLVPTEHQEQVTFVQLLAAHLPLFYLNTTAVPHGDLRKPGVAGRLKAEGVSPGYPDILIDVPRGPFHGMRIEMKRRQRSLSRVDDAQRAWGARLNGAGYLAVVARGCDHAMDQVLAYSALGRFNPSTAVEWTRFELLEPRDRA